MSLTNTGRAWLLHLVHEGRLIRARSGVASVGPLLAIGVGERRASRDRLARMARARTRGDARARDGCRRRESRTPFRTTSICICGRARRPTAAIARDREPCRGRRSRAGRPADARLLQQRRLQVASSAWRPLSVRSARAKSSSSPMKARSRLRSTPTLQAPGRRVSSGSRYRTLSTEDVGQALSRAPFSQLEGTWQQQLYETRARRSARSRRVDGARRRGARRARSSPSPGCG